MILQLVRQVEPADVAEVGLPSECFPFTSDAGHDGIGGLGRAKQYSHRDRSNRRPGSRVEHGCEKDYGPLHDLQGFVDIQCICGIPT